ncbi:hypothetical protein GDO86_007905 [Hymenochirus boettgeri]|uniref:Uncharacterized protein n=1 Tax=Hymenochirus boettgeri TaxID=247094 RepID=A0A8T2J0S9_9PIPI|nr:hypothetical protein GDO86_007905 [Hymenochirus boettgeri]
MTALVVLCSDTRPCVLGLIPGKRLMLWGAAVGPTRIFLLSLPEPPQFRGGVCTCVCCFVWGSLFTRPYSNCLLGPHTLGIT